MESIEMNFSSAGSELAGTLLLPADSPAPVALLLSGSGPIDRNSNMKRQKLNVMRDVAEHLAAAGIASYRYDKRGVGASEGDFWATGLYDNIADAAAALEALQRRPEIEGDKVIVIGHSEGALIGAELATSSQTAGLIMLAGPARPGEAILRWQAEQIAPTIPAPVRAVLRLLRKDVVTMQEKRLAQLRESQEDVIRIQLMRVNAKWFREFLDFDPARALRRARVPILAITGAKDIQVDPDDVGRMAELVPTEFTGEVLDDVTHLLRRDDAPPGLKTYRKQMKRPVDRRLLEMTSAWIKRLTVEAEDARHEAR